MAWFLLFVAGLLEVGWAVGLKYTEGFTRPLPTVSNWTSWFVLTFRSTRCARCRQAR